MATKMSHLTNNYPGNCSIISSKAAIKAKGKQRNILSLLSQGILKGEVSLYH